MASQDQSLVAGGADSSSPLLSFFCDEAPEPGTVTKVIDGVYWVRMRLPMQGLDHINLWLLQDGDEWVIVDTGLGSKESKTIWQDVFSGLMEGRPVNRVICTHLHPDHVGLAGWITKKFDAPLLMTRGEYFLCRVLASDTGKQAPPEGISFYRRAGYTDDQLEQYRSRFGGFGMAITPLPNGYKRIQDGDEIEIDGRIWRIIVGSGHSPEHACLYCEELNICLTGDQLLPNISSNVSVWPTEPDANPLEDWISSCQKLQAELPEDVLVCPAHGLPFRGAHRRLGKLIKHHEKALDRLYERCAEPRLATEVYACLFRRSINDGNRIMAVGESIAHLNCLWQRGQVKRRLNDAGQFVYKAS